MEKCYICPNLCVVDRERELGACLCGADPIVNRAALHFYEEPPISGTRGSGAIFFGGCVMRCEFCQNYRISRKPSGKSYSPRELSELYKMLEDSGAHNINFVSPTPWTEAILASFKYYRPNVPVVWNTSGYETVETVERLAEYVDVWLPDFKYSDEALGRKLSGRKNYPETALSAITKMRELSVDSYSDGIMRSGLIVRHLVLPGYIENSFGVLDAINLSIGNRTVVSIMSQFTPTAESSIQRRLKPIEYKAVVRHAEKCGFENAFIQDEASADSSYTPDFEV